MGELKLFLDDEDDSYAPPNAATDGSNVDAMHANSSSSSATMVDSVNFISDLPNGRVYEDSTSRPASATTATATGTGTSTKASAGEATIIIIPTANNSNNNHTGAAVEQQLIKKMGQSVELSGDQQPRKHHQHHSKRKQARIQSNRSSQFVKRYLKHNPLLNCLLPLTCILVLLLLLYAFKDFPRKALDWIESQEANSWLLFGIFMALFVVVSFPVTVGYLVLIITSGYLFGAIKGLLIVIIGANFGVAVAHYVIKSVQNRLPVYKLIKNETGRAILRVISGPRAFKVVLFCRLTPIPFGLQNTIFGVSAVSPRSYHTATLLGLLPAQAINVYLGSTLRSMHDVLNDHKTAFAGYSVFAVEALVGVLLMVWVVQKARIELSNALLEDIGAEAKLLTAKGKNSVDNFANALLAWLKKAPKFAKRHFRFRRCPSNRVTQYVGGLTNASRFALEKPQSGVEYKL